MHLPCSSRGRGSLYQQTQSSEQIPPSATRLPTTQESRGHQTTAVTNEWASDKIASIPELFYLKLNVLNYDYHNWNSFPN